MTDATPGTSIKTLLTALRKREIKPSEITERTLTEIHRVDKQVGAFLLVDEDGAMTAAKALDQMLDQALDRATSDSGPAASSGNGSSATVLRDAPLFGIPYALKDNMVTKGLRTTAGSRILESYIPPYSATVADQLAAAGGVMIGKTNMDEFAMGSSTENSAYQLTKNPYNTAHVPGGSSGGSAAAVAAGMVPFALGSDTGGSVRQPASYCGVIGLKPTYGRVSRFGLIAFASSLDQIGPFTRTVEDAAYVLGLISGHDPMDSTSAPQQTEDFTADLGKGVKGLKIGVVRDIDTEGLHPGVRTSVDQAVAALESAGAEVIEVSLPNSHYAVAAYYLLAPAEASSNLARYDGVRYGRRASGETLLELYQRSRSEGFGMEVKRRIMIGTYALSSGYYDAYYRRAQQMRTLILRDFATAFEQCDVIATPTAPTTAFRFGEKVGDPLQMYLNDIYTIPANLAGVPGISVPCGAVDGLPVGLQLLGRAFDEKTLLRVAHAYEQVRGPVLPRPEVGVGQ